MGAWGSKPYSNDTAADWFSPVGKFLADRIDEALNAKDCKYDSHYDVWRAAAYLYAQNAENYLYDTSRIDAHREVLLEKLGVIAADDVYIAKRKDAERFSRDLAELTVAVEDTAKSTSEMCAHCG